MKTRTILKALAFILMVSLHAKAGPVAVDQYANLLPGKWSVLSFTYNFKDDHSFSYTTVYAPDHPTSGEWRIFGAKLQLHYNDGTKDGTDQTVGIKFKTPDSWDWIGEGGKIQDVVRNGTAVAH